VCAILQNVVIANKGTQIYIIINHSSFTSWHHFFDKTVQNGRTWFKFWNKRKGGHKTQKLTVNISEGLICYKFESEKGGYFHNNY